MSLVQRVFVLFLVGKLMFSDREARHSLKVSNHWAWSRGGELLLHFFRHNKENGAR